MERLSTPKPTKFDRAMEIAAATPVVLAGVAAVAGTVYLLWGPNATPISSTEVETPAPALSTAFSNELPTKKPFAVIQR